MARAVGAQAEEGRALNTLGCNLSELGDPEAGITALRRALILSREAGSFDDIHRAYLNLSTVLDVDAGRPHEALQVLQQGLKRLRELGLELALPGNTLHTNLAATLWYMGRWREAEEVLNATLTKDVPARFALQLPLLRARLHLAHGRFDLAREQAQTAAQMAEQLIDPASQSSLQKFLAELAVWEGDGAAARSAAAKALQYLTTDDRTYAIRVCHIGLRAEADAAERTHDRRANPFEVADINTTGQQLLDHARESLARLGANLSNARAHAAGCEAEFTRLQLRSDPEQWADLAATWDTISEPYEAAYARWRQAEALLAIKARGAAAVLRQAYQRSRPRSGVKGPTGAGSSSGCYAAGVTAVSAITSLSVGAWSNNSRRSSASSRMEPRVCCTPRQPRPARSSTAHTSDRHERSPGSRPITFTRRRVSPKVRSMKLEWRMRPWWRTPRPAWSPGPRPPGRVGRRCRRRSPRTRP